MSNISNKPEARIENWWKCGNFLIGTVVNHHRQNEFHSNTQQTSALVQFKPEEGYAETQNTYYTLGAKANV